MQLEFDINNTALKNVGWNFKAFILENVARTRDLDYAYHFQ